MVDFIFKIAAPVWLAHGTGAVLVAEIIHHFAPKVIALHNYPPANASKQKQDNWKTLNSAIFYWRSAG